MVLVGVSRGLLAVTIGRRSVGVATVAPPPVATRADTLAAKVAVGIRSLTSLFAAGCQLVGLLNPGFVSVIMNDLT